jgi:hypothetical protein
MRKGVKLVRWVTLLLVCGVFVGSKSVSVSLDAVLEVTLYVIVDGYVRMIVY